ncbi:MAG: formylglycine-generating enzyme family protein [Polyangiales bacterium]
MPLQPLFPDHDEPPPSSQTPVVFETALVPSSRKLARPSVGLRLAPIALLPVFVVAFSFLMGSARRDEAHAMGTDVKRVEQQAKPLSAPDKDLESLTPCPDGMALVVQGSIKICIDRWEATLVQVLPSGEEKPQSPYYSPMTWAGQKVKAVSKAGVVPQAYVSRNQASLACKAAGKRLCTGNEWRAACEGSTQTTYPYGNKHEAKTCNTKGKNPMSMLVGGGKSYLWGSAMHHPLLNTYPHTLAKTGEFAQCTNDFGVYDMVGNLHEWTADGAFRGGYYRDESVNGPGCRYQTTAHGPTYSDYSTGFRCCADPE